MNVKLLAHTKLADNFLNDLKEEVRQAIPNDRQAVALTAIRTCYSANYPSQIVELEGRKYFSNAATDGEGGTEAERLFRHIIRSKHVSTLEHINYTFIIEGVSRSLLAQLTRHRHFSYSVQSQRYVRFGSKDKSGGMEHVKPYTCDDSKKAPLFREIGNGEQKQYTASEIYDSAMDMAQTYYDLLREAGVPAEDARFVLPNGAACNLVLTGSLRSILELYGKRREGNGAQWEIAELVEEILKCIIEVDGWLAPFFEETKKVN